MACFALRLYIEGHASENNLQRKYGFQTFIIIKLSYWNMFVLSELFGRWNVGKKKVDLVSQLTHVKR